jgi:MFS family permease
MLAFTVGDRLGRKKTILVACAIMAVGTALKASSYSLAQMFVGRIVLGQVSRILHEVSGLMSVQSRKWPQYGNGTSLANRNSTGKMERKAGHT